MGQTRRADNRRRLAVFKSPDMRVSLDQRTVQLADICRRSISGMPF